MSYEPPTPPAELPIDLVDTLNGYSPDQLQEVAHYSEALAEHKEREARLEEESEDSEVKERPDDLPDEVPTKATITINTSPLFLRKQNTSQPTTNKGPSDPDSTPRESMM
jgi:hypothetical protein